MGCNCFSGMATVTTLPCTHSEAEVCPDGHGFVRRGQRVYCPAPVPPGRPSPLGPLMNWHGCPSILWSLWWPLGLGSAAPVVPVQHRLRKRCFQGLLGTERCSWVRGANVINGTSVGHHLGKLSQPLAKMHSRGISDLPCWHGVGGTVMPGPQSCAVWTPATGGEGQGCMGACPGPEPLASLRP